MTIVLVYCDANIFIDYYTRGSDRLRPLQEFAFNFFQRGWSCEFHLVISDWLMHEVKKKLSDEDIEDILRDFRVKNKLHEVKQEPGDWDLAKKYQHPDDALHAILAKRAGATVLVTRNIKDYAGCDLVPVRWPEWF